MADLAERETTDETEATPRWRRRLGSLLRWETMLVLLLLAVPAGAVSSAFGIAFWGSFLLAGGIAGGWVNSHFGRWSEELHEQRAA